MEDKRNKKRILSQVVAVMIKNLLMMLVGMSAGFVVVLIPSLTDVNSKEKIYLNEGQTSWASAILPIASMIGSLFSGAITDPLGRKGSMIILTIPSIMSWVSYYFAQDVTHVFGNLALHGVVNGLIEVPVLTYVAEVTEPHLKAALSATTLLSLACGVFLEILIGSWLHWKTLALVSAAVPTVTIFFLLLLPETPYWLLLQKKPEEARKSLAWLRGWTTAADIEDEFQEIQKHFYLRRTGVSLMESGHSRKMSTIEGGQSRKISTIEGGHSRKVSSIKITNSPPLGFNDLVKRSILKPFFLIEFLFIWVNFVGIATTQTYSIIVLSTLQVPMNKYCAAVLMSFSRVLASAVCIFFVRSYGKRTAALLSAFGLCICNAYVGIYAYTNNITRLSFTNEEALSLTDGQEDNYKWIPLLLLIVFGFVSHFGSANLPWILVGEVFSNKTRVMGCGSATSFHYLSAFVANLVYLDMISLLSLSGVYGLYAGMCIVGVIVIHFLVPETDGRTSKDSISQFTSHASINRGNSSQFTSRVSVNRGNVGQFSSRASISSGINRKPMERTDSIVWVHT